MKRTNMLMFGAAGIAAAVLAVLIYAQAVASSEEIRDIEIPFSVDIYPDEIEIEKGETLTKKVLVESPKDAEFDLNFEVFPYDEGSGISAEQTTDKTPDVKLDKIKVRISKDSTKIQDPTPGREMKDSGASITITVPTDAPPGTYMYMLEAKSNPNAEGLVLGSGELFAVIVK